MNKSIVLLALTSALFIPPAMANDGGIPYIKVKSIRTTIPRGQEIVIAGGDAYKLYQAMPRDYVFDVSRLLTITSARRSVVINCRAQPKDPNAHIPTANLATAECTISIEAPFDPKANTDTDGGVWTPSCKE